MPKKTLYLISYILNDQPRSMEVTSDSAAMTPDQARFYLGSIHTCEIPEAITDIQVTRIVHPKKDGPTPAHDLLP